MLKSRPRASTASPFSLTQYRQGGRGGEVQVGARRGGAQKSFFRSDEAPLGGGSTIKFDSPLVFYTPVYSVTVCMMDEWLRIYLFFCTRSTALTASRSDCASACNCSTEQANCSGFSTPSGCSAVYTKKKGFHG